MRYRCSKNKSEKKHFYFIMFYILILSQRHSYHMIGKNQTFHLIYCTVISIIVSEKWRKQRSDANHTPPTVVYP